MSRVYQRKTIINGRKVTIREHCYPVAQTIARDRAEAIGKVWEQLDRHPGRRRKPAVEAYQVVKVSHDPGGYWYVTYREKK